MFCFVFSSKKSEGVDCLVEPCATAEVLAAGSGLFRTPEITANGSSKSTEIPAPLHKVVMRMKRCYLPQRGPQR